MINFFFRFIISGGITTGIDFVLYLFLANYIYLYIAKAISMIIAMVCSFFINRYWSFNNTTIKVSKSIPRFIFAQSINLVVNISSNYLIFILLNNKIIAFIGATFIAMIVNFILQKNYVFCTK